MQSLIWNSKKRCPKRICRNLRAISRKHQKTNRSLLLSAIRKIDEGAFQAAVQDIERFELVARSICAGDRAMLQSIKAELTGSRISKLLKATGLTIVSIIVKYAFALFWSRLVGKDLIYFRNTLYVSRENYSGSAFRNSRYFLGSTREVGWCGSQAL